MFEQESRALVTGIEDVFFGREIGRENSRVSKISIGFCYSLCIFALVFVFSNV